MFNKSVKKRGFSLIEVLVFVTILSVFIIIAISVSVNSLRNIQINQHKILATKYSQELVDWLRGQKEEDFLTFAADRSDKTWCFKTVPVTGWPALSGVCQAGDLINSIFKREVALVSNASPATSINVTVTVSWSELGNTYSVPVGTIFTIFE